MNFTGKENNKMVSIIVPVFNASDTIVEAIRSVIYQTYKEWEIILVNDGSTDDSATVIESFVDSLSPHIKRRITIINKKNEGPSVARNIGINMSKGHFIAFLDSDDMWISEKLSIQINSITNNNKTGIVGGGRNYCLPHEAQTVLINFRTLLLKNYFPTSTVLIERSKLHNARFSDTQRYCEDYRLWLQITSNYDALYLNRVLARTITGKMDYGASGLSANLWAMEKGELMNYYSLFAEKKIKFAEWILYSSLSLLKYIRRLLIIKFRLHGK